MTVSLFLMLLTIFSAITGICTEGFKKIFEEDDIKYSSNVLAFGIACTVGCVGTIIYYVLCGIPITINNLICMVLMGFASAMGAMVGYDKIIQTIKQLDACE